MQKPDCAHHHMIKEAITRRRYHDGRCTGVLPDIKDTDPPCSTHHFNHPCYYQVICVTYVTRNCANCANAKTTELIGAH